MADLLGTFEQMCLMGLIRLKEDAYGRTIHEELESRTGRSIPMGQVYVTLQRLEDKGLVRSEVGGATEVRGGRAKRYFTITANGARALNDTRGALNALGAGLLVPRRA